MKFLIIANLIRKEAIRAIQLTEKNPFKTPTTYKRDKKRLQKGWRVCYNFFMNEKLKRVIAIIALVCMGLFSIVFVAYLLNKTLLNGAIGFCALFFGAVGVALYLVLWISTRGERNQKIEPTDDESENADEDTESSNEKKD